MINSDVEEALKVQTGLWGTVGNPGKTFLFGLVVFQNLHTEESSVKSKNNLPKHPEILSEKVLNLIRDKVKP